MLILKMAVAAVIVGLVTELAKRSPKLGGLIASLPVVSIVSLWVFYLETKNVEKVSRLALDIALFLLPSLTLFVVLTILLKTGLNFHISMAISIALTLVAYAVYYKVVGI